MSNDALCFYRLDLNKLTLSECTGRSRQLIDVCSATFAEIAVKCTDLLDKRPYAHMFVDENEQIGAHLTQLGLNFRVKEKKTESGGNKKLYIESSTACG